MKRFIVITVIIIIVGIVLSLIILLRTPATKRMITGYILRRSLRKADMSKLIPDEESRVRFKKTILKFVEKNTFEQISEEKIKEIRSIIEEITKDESWDKEEVELLIKKMNEAIPEKGRR
jgi:MFS superfamily sulfate permease-like transporter